MNNMLLEIEKLDMHEIIEIGKISQKKMTLSYIPLSKVDPDHLAAFVSLCQMNGGRHAA